MTKEKKDQTVLPHPARKVLRLELTVNLNMVNNLYFQFTVSWRLKSYK
jgi:hypothetical protein